MMKCGDLFEVRTKFLKSYLEELLLQKINERSMTNCHSSCSVWEWNSLLVRNFPVFSQLDRSVLTRVNYIGRLDRVIKSAYGSIKPLKALQSHIHKCN
jgi:hypothetical protein